MKHNPIETLKGLKLWGGFVDGKLSWAPVNITGSSNYGPAALYHSKREAGLHFEDVRRVVVRMHSHNYEYIPPW